MSSLWGVDYGTIMIILLVVGRVPAVVVSLLYSDVDVSIGGMIDGPTMCITVSPADKDVEDPVEAAMDCICNGTTVGDSNSMPRPDSRIDSAYIGPVDGINIGA